MARHPAPADPAQPPAYRSPLDEPHPIVPVMACAFCARTLVLSATGWRHRGDMLAARLPLDRLTVQELRKADRRRG